MRGAQAAPGTWLLCLRSDQDQTCSAWSQDGMNLKELEDLRATGMEFLKSHKDVDPSSWWKKKLKVATLLSIEKHPNAQSLKILNQREIFKNQIWY